MPVEWSESGRSDGARRYTSRERFGVGITGLALILLAVCIITLTPSPVDKGQTALVAEVLEYLHAKGVPQWFGYHKLEFSANIAMFVPLGFFFGLLLPLRRAWIGGLAGTTFSVFVEVVQFFVLPERFASVVDVLANTLGGWIGIGLAVLLRIAIAARDRRVAARRIPNAEDPRPRISPSAGAPEAGPRAAPLADAPTEAPAEVRAREAASLDRRPPAG